MHLWTIISSGPQGWQVPNPQWHTWCFMTKLRHTASTDRRCEYLNGYVTVQHSFGKPSFLDPQSLIVETRDSTLACRDSILASWNSKRLSFETRGSSIEFRVSSVNLHLSGTVEKTSHSLMCECFPNGCGAVNMHLVYPQNFVQPLSSISLGTTVLPRRNWKKKGYAKFWGVNRVHYGLYENCEC